MTTLPPGARALLDLARGSLEPTQDDQQRVEERLAAALAPVLSHSIDSDSLAAPPPAAPPLAALPPTAPIVRAVSFFSRTGLRASALASVGFLIGGVAGYQLGFSRATHSGALPTPPVRNLPNLEQPQHPPSTILNPAPESALTEHPITPSSPPPRSGSSSPAPRAVSARNTAAATASANLDNEVHQVQRVERALRQGNAQLALSLLADLQTTLPRGRLQQERAAARCLAHCMLNEPGHERELQNFEQQYPRSVHLNRLREACLEN
jgi:hypothetical protein